MSTPKVERLVNLTIALLETRRPLTFAEIRRKTGYYDQSDAESARRMFERDKDDLRRLGVPVRTRSTDAFDVEQGYLVDRRDYELPDVNLSPDEVAALALAVRLTGEEGTRLALTKLVARAPDPAELQVAATTRVEVAADPVDPIADALVSRATVTFPYRTAAGTTAQRRVDPYAVAKRRGAWYLLGHDHDRDDLRAFRLDRIRGDVEVVGEPGAFESPEDLNIAALVAGPENDRVEVEVAVSPELRWAFDARGATDTGRTHRDHWPVLRVPGIDPWRDRSWLLGFGPDVEVLAPAELRDAVRDALAAIRDAHRPQVAT